MIYCIMTYLWNVTYARGKTVGELTRWSVWTISKLFIIRGAREKNLAPSPRAHSVAGLPFLAAWSVWVSPKHALSFPSLHTHFLPDDLSISVASEHIHCALENDPCNQSRCQNAHRFTQPYVLSVTQCSVHMQWLRHAPICFSLWLCERGCVCVLYMTHVYLCLFFFFSSSYRGIQHQHSGEAASHHRLCSCRLGLPHCCGRHHHRL